MTIELENGWAQWDYQIGTFRAEIGSDVYGLFTGDIATPDDLETAIGITLTQSQKDELAAEKLAAGGE